MHGRLVTRRARPGGVVSEAAYAAGSALAPHAHRRTSVCVVLAGAFDEERADRRERCGPGAVLVRPAGAAHANRFVDPTRVLTVELALRACRRDGLVDAGPVADLARAVHATLGRAVADPVATLALDDALDALADRLAPRARPGWLRAVQELVRARIPDVPPLAELARAVGVHPVHVARGFRAHLGRTVGDEIRRRRVERACAALAAGVAPASAAAAAGFCDQSHMNRVFRRTLDVTPAAYRAR